MKYLKLYEEFNQDLIDKLIEDTKRTGEEHGVKIIFENSKTVPYIVGGFPCSGYFVDYGNPTLAVAIGKPKEEFTMVLVHESCHMDQWIEKSPSWNNNFIDGKESVDYIDEWLSGKEFTPEELDNFIRRSIEVESDCERRTIEKAKSYNLPINIEEETQKANSYILFYSMLKEVRKWNVSGKAPYQIKEVWSQMPKTFDMDYYNVPENLKELYLKYCFAGYELENYIISGKNFKNKYATDFNGEVAKVIYTKNLDLGSNLGKGSYWNVTQDSLDIYSGNRDEELDSKYGQYFKNIIYKKIDDNLKIFVKDEIADELWDNEKLYNKIKNISDGIYDPSYDDYGLLLFENQYADGGNVPHQSTPPTKIVVN